MDAQGPPIVFDEARNNGVSLPVTSIIDQFYAVEVEAMGGKRWDTSSLFARQEAERQGSNEGWQMMDKSVPGSRSRPYHHGDLRNGLLEAARTILEGRGSVAAHLARRGAKGRRQPCRALSPFSQP